MTNFLNKIFSKKSFAGSAANSTLPPRDSPATIQDGSENATRRQLVQVLTRDAVRRTGVPPEWIDCQMLVVTSQSRGSGMYVRLVMKHWDTRLMTYAYAFQKELQSDITRFDPTAASWLHGISWQFDIKNICPYSEMPAKSVWSEPLKQTGASAAPLAAAAAAAPSAQALPAGNDIAHQAVPAFVPVRPARAPTAQPVASELNQADSVRPAPLLKPAPPGAQPSSEARQASSAASLPTPQPAAPRVDQIKFAQPLRPVAPVVRPGQTLGQPLGQSARSRSPSFAERLAMEDAPTTQAPLEGLPAAPRNSQTEDDTLADLAKLFAVRDQELMASRSSGAGGEGIAVGYEPTQPQTLRR